MMRKEKYRSIPEEQNLLSGTAARSYINQGGYNIPWFPQASKPASVI
ncbi:MAG: hypothetical protein ACM3S2_03450 [Ignavibacteriales bacterium]